LLQLCEGLSLDGSNVTTLEVTLEEDEESGNHVGDGGGSLIMGQVSGSPRGDATARSSTASAAGTHSHRSGTMQWRPPMRMSHDGIGPMPSLQNPSSAGPCYRRPRRGVERA
jgi:hypothetical protein